MLQKQATFPIILNCGDVVEDPKATDLASGQGDVAIIPSFKDIIGPDHEIQSNNAHRVLVVETNTGPD